MSIRIFLCALVLFQAVASAQPFLYYRGVRNAASMLPPDHPSGAIAQGSTFTIAGRNLAPADGTLDNVTVTVSQGGFSSTATPVSASPSQVTAVMPPDAPLGRVSVRVLYNGRSNATQATVVTASVGLYSGNGLGFGPASAQNLANDGTATPNTTQTPAQPGQTIALSITGLGSALDIPLEIFLGGELTSPTSISPSQIAFSVPSDAVLGCYVPVQVRTNGTVASNTVTISISPDGSPCSDAFNPVSTAFQAGGKIGVILPQRVVAHVDSPPEAPFDVTSDWINAALQQVAPGAANFNPLVSLPPLETCTVFGTDQAWPGLFVPPAAELDAGNTLTLTGAAAPATVTADPAFDALLAKMPDLDGAPLLSYSGPGPFGFSLPGGAQIGPLSGAFTMPQVPSWTNRDQISVVDRTQPLSVAWTGIDPGNLAIVVGHSSDVPHHAEGFFVCTANAGDGAFTIPQYVLGALPASVPGSAAGATAIAVGAVALPNPLSVSASGLDAGFLVPSTFSLKTVVMQ